MRLFVICLLLYALSQPVSATTVLYATVDEDFLYTCPLEAPIIWTVHGIQLTANSSEHTIYPNGSILITPVTSIILGLFVSNRCCRESDNVCDGFIIVEAQINPPKADNMTALEYSDVTLSCTADDTLPPPTYSWYRDGNLLTNDRLYQLTNVSREDSGVYTCAISNPLGARSTDMQLTIEYAPTTSVLDTGARYSSVGDTISLQCGYTGKPVPVVTWHFGKDGELSGASEILNPNVDDSVDSVTLVLTSVRKNNTGYYFCFASNNRGNSFSRFQVIVRTVPQAPIVSILDKTATTITIKWEYTDNGNSPITRTFLEHRANNSDWQNNLISGNFTTGFTFTQLSANTVYLIKVSVLNAVGMSPAKLKGTSTNPLPPPEPRGVVLRVLSQEALELAWDPPLLTFEHTPVIRYEYQTRLQIGGTWSSTAVSYSADAVQFSDLSAGTFYEARVRAINSAGASQYVTVHSMTMYTVPGSPELSAVPLDFQTIRVSWSPRTTGGSPILSWSIEILTTSGVWSHLETLAASETLYEINDLQPNTIYAIRILVTNMLGDSPYSVAMVTTDIKGEISAVSIATVELVTHNSITLSWSSVEYEDISERLVYQIEYSLANSLQTTSEYTTEQTSYTFQGLEPLSTYRFSIIARDGNDVSVIPLVVYSTTTLPPIQIVKTPSIPVLGENFQLSCIFSEMYKGVYSPDYVAWYKGGREMRQIPQNLQPDDFYVYKNNLVFPIFETSHYGNYSCRVRDMYTYEYIYIKNTLALDFLREHMEIFIIAAVILGCFIIFICLLVVVLCCICCCRKRQKARIARNTVGIPKKSWLKNASLYSPLTSGDNSGLNPLRTEVDTHHGPRSASEPDRLLEPDVTASYPGCERIYATSFMHNGSNTPSDTPEPPPLMRATIVPALDRFDGASSQSSKVDSDVQAPAPPPPFSSHDVFGDSVSLPKRLTITEGLNSFRYEREGFGSPPSSVATAPNFDNVSDDSTPHPHYENLKMENGAVHVQGIELINIPSNCISTDI